MLKSIYVLFFLLTAVSEIKSRSVNDEPLELVMRKVYERISSYQTLKPVDFKPTFPFPTWAQKLGLYESIIRVNAVGNELLHEFRDGPTSVHDNDMFSTGWVLTALLEAELYGKGAPEIDPYNLQLALEAMNLFSNKNDQNSNQTLVRTFWPQQFNKTTNLWFQEPINIATFLDIIKEYYEIIPIDSLVKFFKEIGLESIAKFLENFEPDKVFGILNAFTIPPDFDDTYLNLGLGSTLKRLSNKYPESYKSWLKNNTDCKGLIDLTTKYAYRPFDNDTNKNTIDPRTYFYARNFIQNAELKAEPVSLITTWIQNIDDQRKLKAAKISMPFNVNNVDLTVSANAIYGISSASIDNVNNFGTLFTQSEDLQHIYLNTTRFISDAINTNFSGRPDLALVYYPSKYNFLWYTSRTLFLLQNEFASYNKLTNLKNPKDYEYLNHFESMKDIFNQALSYLSHTFEDTVTQFLINSRLDTELNDESYFCDFIGADDTNTFGKKESSNDDCLFTTSQAINILIATWTIHHKDTNKLVMKSETPQKVIDLINTSVNWLKRNALNPKFKAMNAFFSGSVKGTDTVPFFYPTSQLKYLNGSDADLNNTDDIDDIIVGFKGSVSEEVYKSLLNQLHYHRQTPLDFHGYNKDIMPFWSSKP